MALIAGALVVLATAQALETEHAIVASIERGERVLGDSARGFAYELAKSDDRIQIPIAVIASGATSSAVLPTVQLLGAKPGYLLTRSPDGCWRLPADGHCWRVVQGDHQ